MNAVIRDPLSGDWIRGYTAAIFDISTHLVTAMEDIKRFKKPFNVNRAKQFNQTYLAHREELRVGRGFIRFNNGLDKFEYFQGVD